MSLNDQPPRRPQGVCGDYEQTAGELTFEPGQIEKHFYVRIMDDHCRERCVVDTHWNT